MKKLFSVSLVLALVLAMLAGCGLADQVKQLTKDKDITSGDLTLTVPGLYVDLAETVDNDALSFVYGMGDTAVLGVRETRADVQNVMPDTDTAREYAELFIEANGVEAEVSEKDGIVTFTYSASAGNQSFTYLCGAYANDNSFWVVQAYCYTENFEDNKSDFWDILKSVKV